ncbi:MAG: nitrite/sulfite reductase [Sedimentisphaerales bacterium]|nr:nitrite/sulfite reductase [Sedimentisphaerales bacterium]
MSDSIASKLYGLYPQKQQGLYMQRVKIPGGRINWSQWRLIAELQERFACGTPIHLTTRQDIELHNLPAEGAIEVKQSLSDAGLDLFGAGGDNLRNITVCPGCEFCHDGFDVFELSKIVSEKLRCHPAIMDLPRKFKISFSGCPASCTKPYLNDIGFIAHSENSFEVITAGSLGPVPVLGIRAYEKLPSSDILPLCFAAIDMFAEYGDRENRRKARFRHVRQKLGDEAFLMELDKRFKSAKENTSWPQINITKNDSQLKFIHRLHFPDGNISTQDALALAQLCEPAGIEARITFDHGIELYGEESLELPGDFKKFKDTLVIIACPGAKTCSHGLIDCQSASANIRAAFTGNQFGRMKINISGCPNNCAHSSCAAIGLVGLKRDKKDCVQLYTGGGDGKNQNLAQKGEIETVANIASLITSIKI